MKRRLFKLVLFLLLGVIVNIAVVLGCVYWVAVPNQSGWSLTNEAKSPEGPHYQYWSVSKYHRPGATRIVSQWYDPELRIGASYTWNPNITPQSLIPDWADNLVPIDISGQYDCYVRFVDARGWPLLAMWSSYEVNATSIDNLNDAASSDWGEASFGKRISDRPGWRVTQSGSNIRLLPTAIFWSAFSINSAIYAIVLFLLLLMLRLVRLTIKSLSAKQRLLLVFVNISFGILTTIALAWSLAAWTAPDQFLMSSTYTFERDQDVNMRWSLSRNTSFGRTRFNSDWKSPVNRSAQPPPITPSELLAPWAQFANAPQDQKDKKERHRIVEGLGWPMRALWYGYELEKNEPTNTNLNQTQKNIPPAYPFESSKNFVKAIQLKTRTGPAVYGYNFGLRALPLGPIVGGLLVDSLIFAIGWICITSMIASPLTIRRSRRRKRGLCIKCGYDLRGNSGGAVCPECGVEICARAKAPS